VRHRDLRRRAALAFGDPVDDPADQPGGQLLRRPGPAADDDRGGVADAPLELADHAVRVGQRAALGRLADDDAAVRGHEHYGRDGGGARAEGDDLRLDPTPLGGTAHRRRRVGRTDIDAELIAHDRLLTPRYGPLPAPVPRIGVFRATVSTNETVHPNGRVRRHPVIGGAGLPWSSG
jgi:hypothetical protein